MELAWMNLWSLKVNWTNLLDTDWKISNEILPVWVSEILDWGSSLNNPSLEINWWNSIIN